MSPMPSGLMLGRQELALAPLGCGVRLQGACLASAALYQEPTGTGSRPLQSSVVG